MRSTIYSNCHDCAAEKNQNRCAGYSVVNIYHTTPLRKKKMFESAASVKQKTETREVVPTSRDTTDAADLG